MYTKCQSCLSHTLSCLPRQAVLLPTSPGIEGRRGIISSAVCRASLPTVLAQHFDHRSRRLPAERDGGPSNDLGRASSNGAGWRPAATWVDVERCRTCWSSTSQRRRRRLGRRQGSAAEGQKTVRRRTMRWSPYFGRRRQNQSACRFLRKSSTIAYLTLHRECCNSRKQRYL